MIGQRIRDDFLDEVKSAKVYSIIMCADEVTDVASREEVSLVVRYIHDHKIKEVFLDFLEVERITGVVMAQAILQWLRAHGLSPANMHGQCYDGASNMSGARSGCKAIVQQEAPYHCTFTVLLIV